MSLTFIAPVDVTPSTSGAWTDVDISSHVPSEAAIAVLHIANEYSSALSFGVRKNGSTDNRTNTVRQTSHIWGFAGLDANRIFEAYLQTASNQKIYLVGYYDSSVVALTNAVDKSLSATNAWTDIDISSDTSTDTAIGALFEVVSAATVTYGFRKNGSTDDRVAGANNHSFAIVGVDVNEVCEGKISATTVDYYLAGYIKSASIFNTNATDLSLGSTGAWTDLSSLPSGAIGGYIEIHSSSYSEYGLRKNGTSEDIYKYTPKKNFAIVECDASRLIEGKIASTDTDFFLVGYPEASAQTITASAGVSGEGLLSASGQVVKTGSGTVSGAGSLIAEGKPTRHGSVVLSGSERLQASGIRIVFGSATISGASQVLASISGAQVGAAAISGSGTIAASALVKALCRSELTGQGYVIASAADIETVLGKAVITGSGIAEAISLLTVHARAGLEGSGLIVATAESDIMPAPYIISPTRAAMVDGCTLAIVELDGTLRAVKN